MVIIIKVILKQQQYNKNNKKILELIVKIK